MRDYRSNIPSVLISVIFLLLIMAVFLPVLFIHFNEEVVTEIESRDSWQLYTDQEYGFSIEHPPEWSVVALPDHLLVPKFHFLPPESEVADIEGIDHHTDVPNISIFPQGYPTEGIFGDSGPSRIYFGSDIEEATEYYLLDGDVWARSMTLESLPDGWNEYGFIWSRVSVDGYRAVCFADGEEVSKDRCDPALGHEIRRRGKVDQLERKIHEEILRSFEILE